MKHLKNFNQYIIKESLSEFDNEDVSKWKPIYEYFYEEDVETPTKEKKITKYKREDGNTLTLQPNGKWKSSKSGNEYSQAAIDNLVNNHEVNVVTWEPVHEKSNMDPFKLVTYDFEVSVVFEGFDKTILKSKLMLDIDKIGDNDVKNSIESRMKMLNNVVRYEIISFGESSEQIRPMY